MKVGLLIYCYIDQLYPKVAIATLKLLEKLGLEVHFPTRQTCYGQPPANSDYLFQGRAKLPISNNHS